METAVRTDAAEKVDTLVEKVRPTPLLLPALKVIQTHPEPGSKYRLSLNIVDKRHGYCAGTSFYDYPVCPRGQKRKNCNARNYLEVANDRDCCNIPAGRTSPGVTPNNACNFFPAFPFILIIHTSVRPLALRF